MKRIELQMKKRETIGNGRAMRRDGYVPAVMYGPETETVMLAINSKTIEKILREGGLRALFDLDIEGSSGKEEKPLTIIKEVQYHPMGKPLLHIDFYKVTLGKELDVSVPIILVGTAVGQEVGGNVDQVLREADVSCFPSNIPESIEIDVTELDIGDSISFGDITPPEGVTFYQTDDVTIVSVKMSRLEIIEPEEDEEEIEGEEGEEGEVAEGEEAKETSEE